MNDPLLSIRDLRVSFETPAGTIIAVNGVDLDINRGATVGLVGESGSGKSVTALAVLRLLPARSARIERGTIRFESESLLDASSERMRAIRGARIAMIFQDPMTSLNPLMTVGDQVAEAIRLHQGASRREAWQRAVRALDEVGIHQAGARARDYPHQFSGGMRQRVMIAMAIGCEPSLLIADEPTTALDVTVQSEILDLLQRLREAHGMAILLITHDLSIVAEFCRDVAVMYAGRIVEQAPAVDLFGDALHPYTRGLLASTPDPEAPAGSPFQPIPGAPPRPGDRIGGCPFHPRCAEAMPVCRDTAPPLLQIGQGLARCHLLSVPDAVGESGAPDRSPRD